MGTGADTSLASVAGYAVAARDGHIGVVETPLFPPDAAEPDFLVLRVGSWPRTRRPVMPAVLVERVDAAERVVHVAGRKRELESLSERLPIAV